MNESLYLSRSFVEFGPFSLVELQGFYKRGILQDSDYVSASGGAWVHVSEWAAALPAPAPAPKEAAPAKKAAPKAKAAEPAPVAAAAPAKKAATKKAKK